MAAQTDSKALIGKSKADGLSPRSAIKLDTLANVRGEMARLYRLGLKGTLDPSDMTRFVYVLKEVRACIEAELLDDVQSRLAALTASVGARRG